MIVNRIEPLDSAIDWTQQGPTIAGAPAIIRDRLAFGPSPTRQQIGSDLRAQRSMSVAGSGLASAPTTTRDHLTFEPSPTHRQIRSDPRAQRSVRQWQGPTIVGAPTTTRDHFVLEPSPTHPSHVISASGRAKPGLNDSAKTFHPTQVLRTSSIPSERRREDVLPLLMSTSRDVPSLKQEETNKLDT